MDELYEFSYKVFKEMFPYTATVGVIIILENIKNTLVEIKQVLINIMNKEDDDD